MRITSSGVTADLLWCDMNWVLGCFAIADGPGVVVLEKQSQCRRSQMVAIRLCCDRSQRASAKELTTCSDSTASVVAAHRAAIVRDDNSQQHVDAAIKSCQIATCDRD